MTEDTRRYPLPESWNGWSWTNQHLTDPQGNRYSPDMVRASIYAYELAHELTGSDLQVRSLKQALREKLATPPPEIIIRWQGEETIIKPPKWKLKI